MLLKEGIKEAPLPWLKSICPGPRHEKVLCINISNYVQSELHDLIKISFKNNPFLGYMTFKNKNGITSCNLTKLDHSRNTGVSNQAIFSNTSFLEEFMDQLVQNMHVVKDLKCNDFELLASIFVIACFFSDQV